MRFHYRKRGCEYVEQRIVYRVHRPMLQSQSGYGAVECLRQAFLLRSWGFSVHVVIFL
jgi:hypothetical protein